MAKVTADLFKVVWVSIRGESRSGGKLPRLPDDDGVCQRFHQWTIENNIQSPIIAGQKGGGVFIGAFWPEDMEKIVKWLEENGVDCCEFTQESE